MRQDVTEFKKRCDASLRRKAGHRIKASLWEIPMATEFLDIVSLDIVGPLPVSEQGNKYLLTFVDHYTSFCEEIPIARQDTETIERFFVTRILAQFGVPRKL